tara:strand:- start:4779 stop:5855 length:1077 start_codon:yes stop_codon:yes gene_type:complete
MSKKLFVSILFIILIQIGLLFPNSSYAGLPAGNPLKDPNAILRNALPIAQPEVIELQHQLEDTSDLLRGGRWSSLEKSITKTQKFIKRQNVKITDSLSGKESKQAKEIILKINNSLENLKETTTTKDKQAFIDKRRESLNYVGELENLFLPKEFPYNIPSEYDNLPRLLGRAEVSIKTTKGNMTAIIDGYNAPLTSGAFIDLVKRNFYDELPINRAEEFFVLQTGDPIGDAIGFIDENTNEERHVPLEIKIPEEKEIFYNQTFEELGLYTETPTLPFATLGTLGWSHSNESVDDGSSQFFFFLYEAELNPAGRNLIDGRNAAFGYVVEGAEVLEELNMNDKVLSISIIKGVENLEAHA